MCRNPLRTLSRLGRAVAIAAFAQIVCAASAGALTIGASDVPDGVSSATVSGVVFESSPRVFSHKSKPGFTGLGVKSGYVDGEVDRVVLLGCLGDVPVGYAIGAIRPLADDTCAADVTEVFVEEAARGVGIGSLLLHELLHWATDRGCIGIDARALPGDRDTKNFFESFGLVARAITVHRDLRA